MFLNVPSGLRPELIYMHESVSRLCRGHAYFLESLLDLRFFGIWHFVHFADRARS